jgi:hypothetical protein
MTSIFGRNPAIRALAGAVVLVAGLLLGKVLITVAGAVVIAVAGLQALAASRGRGAIGGKGDGRSLR